MEASACEVWFYHLERTALEAVLPELLEKTLARGWRARVRSAHLGRVEALNDRLWTYRDESFLPHGVLGEPFAEHQPILLGPGADNPNGAQALFIVDGDPGDLTGYARCVVIFDGQDEAALAAARGFWSRYKTSGHPVTYWRQGESRGWERQG
jgi:DNA polymerase-3 subunit chi